MIHASVLNRYTFSTFGICLYFLAEKIQSLAMQIIYVICKRAVRKKNEVSQMEILFRNFQTSQSP